jgi:hypothetical protein
MHAGARTRQPDVANFWLRIFWNVDAPATLAEISSDFTHQVQAALFGSLHLC